MPQLDPVARSVSKELDELVTEYNQLPEDAHVEKLFYLQKITNVLPKLTPNPNVIAWRNQLGPAGLEAQLQRYGIHRDSSFLVQSIEFANAVRHYGPKSEATDQSLYEAMQERNKLLAGDMSTETLAHYTQHNHTIMANYDKDKNLQEKIARSRHSLALSYAKIDAIQDFVKQEFNEYQTEILGNPNGNNKNFFFSVDGEDKQMVIRVEDRSSLGKEQELQAHPVSEYFSEDYASIMVPFEEEDEVRYQPVVISELASKGDLEHYSESLTGQPPAVVAARARHYFTQLNDFCLKLMDSGHYHPDIKLSNFLTDGNRVIISDRKTLTDKINPKVNEISSSPAYGAPEYLQCINAAGSGLTRMAYQTTLDMPSYMAYQLGMGLKQFMYNGLGKQEDEQFREWGPLSHETGGDGNGFKNTSVLIQELTRKNPADRLSISNFQILLSKTNLPPQEFMAELETLAPKENLSNHTHLAVITKALRTNPLTPDLKQEIIDTSDFRQHLQDPRLNLSQLLTDQPAKHITQHVQKVEDALRTLDREKASTSIKWLHRLTFGLVPIPRKSTIQDLGDKLPKMDEMTKFYLDINEAAGNKVFQGISAEMQTRLQTLIQHEKTQQEQEVRINTTSASTIESTTQSDTSMDSSTFITTGSVVVKDTIPAIPEVNSGTMVVSSGTVLPNEETVINSGTFVTSEDSMSADPGTFVTSSIVQHDDSENQGKKSPIEAALEAAKQHKDVVKQDSPKAHASDIVSTIKRGNKKHSEPSSTAEPAVMTSQLRSKLTEMKEGEKKSQDEVEARPQRSPSL